MENKKPAGKILEYFHKKHADIFGYSIKERPVEMVNVRLKCRSSSPAKINTDIEPGKKTSNIILTGKRNVFFPLDNSYLETKIYKKTDITEKTKISGPAIIEEIDSTIVIPPGDTAASDKDGNIIIKVRGYG
jgi:N-methylhydantoinase A